MYRKILLMITALSLCLALTACTAKLTTIRPTLITRIVVADIAAGTNTEHQRKTSQELDWLMDELVFLMERQYKQTGTCKGAEAHLFDAEFYMGEKLELGISVHSDGSVCKNGRVYVPRADKGVDPTADLEKWAEFITFNVEG
jgi:hypothetical protein